MTVFKLFIRQGAGKLSYMTVIESFGGARFSGFFWQRWRSGSMFPDQHHNL